MINILETMSTKNFNNSIKMSAVCARSDASTRLSKRHFELIKESRRDLSLRSI